MAIISKKYYKIPASPRQGHSLTTCHTVMPAKSKKSPGDLEIVTRVLKGVASWVIWKLSNRENRFKGGGGETMMEILEILRTPNNFADS